MSTARDAILARRALFVASALGGLSLGAAPPPDDAEPLADPSVPGTPLASGGQPECPIERVDDEQRKLRADTAMARAEVDLAATDWKAAQNALEDAFAATPTFGMLLRQAKLLARYDKNAAALKRVERYRGCAEEADNAAEWTAVERLGAGLWAKTARLTVRIETEHAEPFDGHARVWVDGQPVGRTPLTKPLILDPGTHLVEARIDAEGGSAQTVTLRAAEDSELVLFIRVSRPHVCLSIMPPHGDFEQREGLHFAMAAAPKVWVSTTGEGSFSYFGGAIGLGGNYAFAPNWDARGGVQITPGGSERGLLLPIGAFTSLRYGTESPFGAALGFSVGYLMAPAHQPGDGPLPVDGLYIEPEVIPLSLRFGRFETEVRAGVLFAERQPTDNLSFGPAFVSTAIWFGWLFFDAPEED